MPARPFADGRDGAFRRLDPFRLPVARIEQPHFPAHEIGPLALPLIGPDLDGAGDALTGSHWSAWKRYQQVVIGFDPARIPILSPKPVRHLPLGAFGQPPR